jgi:hypothetical protein
MIVATLLGLTLIPLAAWTIGTAVVHLAPSSFRCEAVVRQPSSGTVMPVGSERVIQSALEELAGAGAGKGIDPMAKHALWSGLSASPSSVPGVFKVAVTGANPDEARRTLMAVVRAYESHHAAASGARLMIYAGPPVSRRENVPPGARMMLGLAGAAWLGLALSIPLLRCLEGSATFEPGILAHMRRGKDLVSAIARASAATGPPPAGGCLPAASGGCSSSCSGSRRRRSGRWDRG